MIKMLRRDGRRLPGTLCDETPPAAVDRSRCVECNGAVVLVPTLGLGLQFIHDAPTGNGHLPVLPTQAADARMVAMLDGERKLRIAAEDRLREVTREQGATRDDRLRRQKLEQQLAEVIRDRNTLERANGRLTSRQRLYRSMLKDLGVADPTIAALEEADREWNERDVDADTVWSPS